ncbi:arginase family protein [Pseudomonas syringae]|uniref:arginase family protein n=1 Tax=Pseudomonas syringae TaxID=317 RepID=UPI0011D0F2CA|nr:arginase family protein [Pseudomonas syringae]
MHKDPRKSKINIGSNINLELELENLGAHSWREFESFPHPGWSNSRSTIFNCESSRLAKNDKADVIVASVPFDTTASTRSGARNGPASVRQASLAYSSQLESRGFQSLRCMRTGKTFAPKQICIQDLGDLHCFPSSTEMQVLATAAETYRMAMLGKLAIVIGGEHTITYPCFYGISKFHHDKTGLKIGYLQIDHHFDFGAESILHGKYYHGSNARRVSELAWVTPKIVGFIGQGDFTSVAQYQYLNECGYAVCNVEQLRRTGVEEGVLSVAKKMLDSCDRLYVSIDIDVCDMSIAPGTGHITVGGITSAEFVDIFRALKKLPVVALDVMEVSPGIDSSGRTEGLVARALYEYVFMDEVVLDG